MLKIFKVFFFVLLFVVIFGIFSVEVGDPDFWWHLKTGEYIYQTGSLPETDPFSFTSLPQNPLNPESKRIKFILTQYWLAQLLFYRLFHFFGFQGIIFLRAAILTFLLFLIYRGVRREGIGTNLSVGFLVPAVIIFYSFTGERPQLFSFLFSFLLIYLLEGFRRNPSSKMNLIPIPFMMLLWANSHGGFILGIIIMAGYLFSEFLKYRTKKFGVPLPLTSLRYLAIVGIISILASLINPNEYKVVPFLVELKRGYYKDMISEIMSPARLISLGLYETQVVTFFVLLFLSVVCVLLNFRRIDLTDLTILTGVTVMGLSAIRFIPFFTPPAILMIARYGFKFINEVNWEQKAYAIKTKAERFFSILSHPSVKTVSYSLMSIVLAFALFKWDLFKSSASMNEYPEGAVHFLKDNRLSGNMFNPYYWGGYLLWALYPDYKVFVDGRGLIEEVCLIEENVMEANSVSFAGVPEWKAYLNAFKINYILTYSVRKYSGQLGPFIPALLHDPEWQLVYAGNNSLIFVKDNAENADIINRFRLPKELAWDEVIQEAFLKIGNVHDKTNFYITIGDAFFSKKDYVNAEEAYLRAREINPLSTIVSNRLKLLIQGQQNTRTKN